MAQARVYKNLNNGLWSIKQKVNGKWVVVGHSREVWLGGVSCTISEARWNHVRSGNHREVFAYMVGDLLHTSGFQPYQDRVATLEGGEVPQCSNRVTFRPFEVEKRGFHYVDSGLPFEGSPFAYFSSEGVRVQ